MPDSGLVNIEMGDESDRILTGSNQHATLQESGLDVLQVLFWNSNEDHVSTLRNLLDVHTVDFIEQFCQQLRIVVIIGESVDVVFKCIQTC